jgi:hypothetical protein
MMICGGMEKQNNKVMDAIFKNVIQCEWLEDFPNLEYWSSQVHAKSMKLNWEIFIYI